MPVAPSDDSGGYEQAEEGTDFVAFVDCETPDAPREAVL